MTRPVRAPVLVLATAAVVALGGLWWSANAPGAGLAALPYGFDLIGTHPVDRASAGTEQVAAAGSATQSSVEFPTPAELLAFDASAVAQRLPPADDLLHRQVLVMTGSTVHHYGGVVTAGTFLRVQLTCKGNGTVQLDISWPDGAPHRQRQSCDSTEVITIEFTVISAGHASFELSAAGSYLVAAGFQVSRG